MDKCFTCKKKFRKETFLLCYACKGKYHLRCALTNSIHDVEHIDQSTWICLDCINTLPYNHIIFEDEFKNALFENIVDRTAIPLDSLTTN